MKQPRSLLDRISDLASRFWITIEAVDDTFEVICPYCFEIVEIYVDPETRGELVQDCDVCCRPWTLNVARTEDGELAIQTVRAQ